MRALLSLAPEDDILRDLMDVAKPPTEAVFDRHLEMACRGGDQRAQFRLLAFANATSAHVSTDTIERIAHLATVGSERVQAEAFEIIARLGDTDRLPKWFAAIGAPLMAVGLMRIGTAIGTAPTSWHKRSFAV